MQDNKYVWLIACCPSNSIDTETCTWLFFEQGAIGVQTEDIDDSNVRIKASFDADNFGTEHLQDLKHKLELAGLGQIAATLQTETIANQDWMSNWKKYFVPFAVGESLLICPPWLIDQVDAKKFNGRKKIIIDPGMAFGTGQHITTAFCLQTIEKWAKGPKILDVGTGSGILAITGALLIPAVQVVALDIDDNSIKNANHNIELNGVGDKIQLIKACVTKFTNGQFNTILSNLTAEYIVDFLPVYNRLLISQGIIILAGIIEERLGMLQNALKTYAWHTVEEKIEKGWVGMVLRKESA